MQLGSSRPDCRGVTAEPATACVLLLDCFVWRRCVLSVNTVQLKLEVLWFTAIAVLPITVLSYQVENGRELAINSVREILASL